MNFKGCKECGLRDMPVQTNRQHSEDEEGEESITLQRTFVCLCDSLYNSVCDSVCV
jgi:hypothetical protein